MTDTADRVRARARIHNELPPPPERRRLREAAGLSRQELADLVLVTRGAIGFWESGLRYPRGDRLTRYAEALTTLRDFA